MCAAPAIDAGPEWHGELAKQPVDAHFLEVVLCDLEKLGLDLHLAWRRSHLRFYERVDEVEVCLGVLDDQLAGARDEVRTGTRRKRYALSFEKLSRTRASLNGRLRAGRNRLAPRAGQRRLTACGQRGYEARRNLILLGDQDIGRLGLGNDGDRIRFDLQFKICGLSDVVDCGSKRDVIKGKRDSRIGFRRIRSNLQDDINSPARRVLLGSVQRNGALFEESPMPHVSWHPGSQHGEL